MDLVLFLVAVGVDDSLAVVVVVVAAREAPVAVAFDGVAMCRCVAWLLLIEFRPVDVVVDIAFEDVFLPSSLLVLVTVLVRPLLSR